LGKTDEERIKELMKQIEANDVGAMHVLGSYYHHGRQQGILQDQAKAMELWKQAAKLGLSQAHFHLGNMYLPDYDSEGNSKKEKFHLEAAAMAGDEGARCNLGTTEAQSRNMEQAVKHWMIAASAGDYIAMRNMLVAFNHGSVSRNAIDSTLTAYNTSCAEMRSEARDSCIQIFQER
jgi:TPR repeat protein